MQYVVRHLTRFVYTAPVSESVMELRMQPLELDRLRGRVGTRDEGGEPGGGEGGEGGAHGGIPDAGYG